MIRILVLAVMGFVVAWISATAYFLLDAIVQNEFAVIPSLHTVRRYGQATYTYGYLGGLLALAAAVSISRTRSVSSRITLWLLLGLVITSAAAAILHHRHFGRLPTAGELFEIVDRLRMLLVPAVAVSVVVPLLEAIWDSTFWKVRRIRRRSSREVAGDVNFDAVAYSELEERAEMYLHEKRKKPGGVSAHHRAEDMTLMDLNDCPK